MFKLKILIFCFVFIHCSFTGVSAVGGGTGVLTGQINYKHLENISSNGAVVKLATLKDTLYTIIIHDVFSFSKLPQGKAVVSILHINFEPISREVEIKNGEKTMIEIELTEKTIAVDTITVKAKIPLISFRGDTIIFNAAAVKLMQGDEAIEVLRHMPGVVITPNGISVIGQQVERTYVDSKLIFGNNAMGALGNLPADDVVSINTYEEFSDPYKKNRRTGDKKVRVLDIKTKSKLVSAVKAHAIVGGGHDFDSDGHSRYMAGVTANFFSEKLLLALNAFSNNTGNNSNRIADLTTIKNNSSVYTENSYAYLGLTRNWGSNVMSDNISLNASYTYNNVYSFKNSIVQRIYASSSDYSKREQSDSMSTHSGKNKHTIILNLESKKEKIGNILLSSKIDFLRDDARMLRSSHRVLDNVRTFDTSNQQAKTTNVNINESLHASKRFRKMSYDINVMYSCENPDGDELIIDTLNSTSVRQIVSSGIGGYMHNMQAQGKISVPLTRQESKTTVTLSTGYAYEYLNDKSIKTAIDMTTMKVDNLNSWNYTNNYTTNNVLFGLGITGNKGNFHFGMDYSAKTTNRDTYYPDTDNFRRKQYAWLPNFSYDIRIGMSSLRVNYSTSAQLPSMEQWRPHLDDLNSYSLIAGNNMLSQSYLHNIMIHYDGMGNNGRFIMAILNANFTNSAIVPKTLFFTSSQYLPKWDYTAPAQSTLTTFDNVDGKTNITGKIILQQPMASTELMLDLSAGFIYDNSPSFVDETLTRTKSYNPNVGVGIRSNFSTVLKLSMGVYGNYMYSTNSVLKDFSRTIGTGGQASAKWNNIFKKLYVETYYNTSFYRSLSGKFDNTTIHTLNASVGISLLKGNMDIGFTAFDILNNSNAFKSIVNANYTQNTWTQSYGRYFMFKIAYKLYRSKSGLKQPKSIRLEDGNVKTDR